MVSILTCFIVVGGVVVVVVVVVMSMLYFSASRALMEKFVWVVSRIMAVTDGMSLATAKCEVAMVVVGLL